MFEDWFDETLAGKNTHLMLASDVAGLGWNGGIEAAANVVERYLSSYPESVFSQPPSGEHGKTVDSCSASALRAILPSIIGDIRKLSATQHGHEADALPRGHWMRFL